MSSALPGVKVGPLDPDTTAEFGQVSGKNSARSLIRFHSQMYPPELLRALGLQQDIQRTQGLDIDEVREYLDGLELENGDPAVPKGAEVEGAVVRGDRDRDQVLTYTYRVPGGRTAKWFAPYNEDVLPESFSEGSERVHIHELREKGLVAQAGSPAGERGTTRNASEAGDVKLARENRKLAEQVEELNRKLAEANARATGEDAEESAGAGEQPATASEEPPLEDYDELKAAGLNKLIKDEETPHETVQAILDFEKTHQNRRSVVGAAEVRLGADGRP